MLKKLKWGWYAGKTLQIPRRFARPGGLSLEKRKTGAFPAHLGQGQWRTGKELAKKPDCPRLEKRPGYSSVASCFWVDRSYRQSDPCQIVL